jgi:hypothetical protein
MLSCVLAQINQFRSLGDAEKRRLPHRFGFPGQRYYGPIVVRIAVRIEHPGALDAAHRRYNRRNPVAIASFGKIRNAFDQAPHDWWKASAAELLGAQSLSRTELTSTCQRAVMLRNLEARGHGE